MSIGADNIACNVLAMSDEPKVVETIRARSTVEHRSVHEFDLKNAKAAPEVLTSGENPNILWKGITLHMQQPSRFRLAYVGVLMQGIDSMRYRTLRPFSGFRCIISGLFA